MTGRIIGNLYFIDVSLPVSKDTAYVGKIYDGLVPLHEKLGHLGCQNILKHIKNNMVQGIDINLNGVKNNMIICETCIQAKQTRNEFSESVLPRSSRILELIHSDVCGPFPVATYDNKIYYVSFIDDYSHFCCIFLLKHKYEIFEKFKEYWAMTSSLFGTKIYRLRCDNGREYIGSNFINFCKANGIQMEYTVPYTPQQNGVSERMNKTLTEKAAAMLFVAKFQIIFRVKLYLRQII